MRNTKSSLGTRYRFESVVSILEDADRSVGDRIRAAAAVLYVNQNKDIIPDSLGVIGIIDDDYALLIVLDQINGTSGGAHLHWSERTASLWDELPFLQGVNLSHGENPISTTWLDRVNSYVSYSHVMKGEPSPLVLLQPSVVCSPLHVIVTLIGLLVFDAVTSSKSKAQALRDGQTYEFDNVVAQFEGISGPPDDGWLRLRMRDGVIYHPPGLADRMVPVGARRLSWMEEFSSQTNLKNADPIQRFFDWGTAVGSASISSQLILVASRHRVMSLFEGVHSNGVKLLDHGIVRFVGEASNDIEMRGALVLVVPSLSGARLILDRGIRAQTIVIDGYQRIHRGRHELPFLANRKHAPSIIVWSTKGYFPVTPPAWFEPCELLEVRPDDLAAILELEDMDTDAVRASLWEAATCPDVQLRIAIREQLDE